MSINKKNAIIVAHPDDETLFFAGLIMSRRSTSWTIVCITDGNADGQGKKRKNDFLSACEKLGAHDAHFLGFPDLYSQRLPLSQVQDEIKKIGRFQEVFTHNPIGEYGHPHHQDVSMAVHTVFNKKSSVWSCAYNCLPTRIINLTPKMFSRKSEILSQTYFSESQRLINFLPCTSVEGFSKIELQEVRALYNYFANDTPISIRKLKSFKWYLPYLKTQKNLIKTRHF